MIRQRDAIAFKKLVLDVGELKKFASGVEQEITDLTIRKSNGASLKEYP